MRPYSHWPCLRPLDAMGARDAETGGNGQTGQRPRPWPDGAGLQAKCGGNEQNKNGAKQAIVFQGGGGV